MANFNELLGTDKRAVVVLGAAVGTIADFAGGIGGALEVAKKFLTFVHILDSGSDQLALIATALQEILKDIKDIKKVQEAQATLERLTRLEQFSAEARSVSDVLQAALNTKPPVDSGTRIALMQKCREAVDNLSAEASWLMPLLDDVYFDDTGKHVFPTFEHLQGDLLLQTLLPRSVDVGYWTSNLRPLAADDKFSLPRFSPRADADNLVFTRRYVLPLWLYVQGVFLTVGAALFPAFVKDFADVIGKDAEFLRTMHDKIKDEGIMSLAPQLWDVPDLFLEAWWGIPDFGVADQAEGFAPKSPRGVSQVLGDFNNLVGLRIDYGAVEIFSGASTPEEEYILLLKDVSPFENANTDSRDAFQWTPPIEITSLVSNPAVNRKFQIRVLKKLKEVYRDIGLVEVWKAIFRLRALHGVIEALPSSFGDWSFLDIFRLLDENSLRNDSRAFSLLKLKTFIELTPPKDTPAPSDLPLGFRVLLGV